MIDSVRVREERDEARTQVQEKWVFNNKILFLAGSGADSVGSWNGADFSVADRRATPTKSLA